MPHRLVQFQALFLFLADYLIKRENWYIYGDMAIL